MTNTYASERVRTARQSTATLAVIGSFLPRAAWAIVLKVWARTYSPIVASCTFAADLTLVRLNFWVTKRAGVGCEKSK